MGRLLAAMLLIFALTGCNTINGVGKDIEKAGEAVQDSSKQFLNLVNNAFMQLRIG